MRYFAQRCTKTELRKKNLYVDPLVEPPIITKFEAKRTRSKIEAEDAADRALREEERIKALNDEQDRQLADLLQKEKDKFSPKEVEQAQQIFAQFDDDRSGYLDRDEITNCLHQLGVLPDHHLHYKVVLPILQQFAVGRKATIGGLEAVPSWNFTGFLSLVHAVKQVFRGAPAEVLVTDAKRFERFDQDRSGELSGPEMQKCMADIGLRPRSKAE